MSISLENIEQTFEHQFINKAVLPFPICNIFLVALRSLSTDSEEEEIRRAAEGALWVLEDKQPLSRSTSLEGQFSK